MLLMPIPRQSQRGLMTSWSTSSLHAQNYRHLLAKHLSEKPRDARGKRETVGVLPFGRNRNASEAIGDGSDRHDTKKASSQLS